MINYLQSDLPIVYPFDQNIVHYAGMLLQIRISDPEKVRTSEVFGLLDPGIFQGPLHYVGITLNM